MWLAQCTMANRLQLFRVAKSVQYLVFLASLYFTGRSEITVISEGQEFLLAFPENLPNDCQFALNLTSTMTSALAGKLNANISVPALHVSKVVTLVAGTGVGISLRGEGLSPDATSNATRNNIIHVNVTGGKISVYGSIMCDSPSLSHRKFGEFLAIPVEFWGTRYIVMSPKNISCGYTVTVLTGDSESEVVLNIRSAKASGRVQIGNNRVKGTIVLTLQPYTRTEICAVSTDITGTILESNYPIGLLVGPNNEASLNAAFCEKDQGLFIEQLIPTYAWGKKYYLIDGGASSNVRYKYDIRVVASTAPTTVYYYYLTSFANLTLRFRETVQLRSAGDIFELNLPDSFGFEMIAAILPVMVVVHTSPTSGGDGAMSQAVQARFFPERIVLRFSPELGQRMYLFTDTACSAGLDVQVLNAFGVNTAYTSLDYDKLGAEFYVNSSTNGEREFLATLSVNTDIAGCSGISAFIMNDIRNEYDVLAACPVFWNVECSDGKYFDLAQKECVSIQTTTLGDILDEPQLLKVSTSNPEHLTSAPSDANTAEHVTSAPSDASTAEHVTSVPSDANTAEHVTSAPSDANTAEHVTSAPSDASTAENTLLNNTSTAKTAEVSILTKECVSIQTTTLGDILDEPQLLKVSTSNPEHVTSAPSDASTAENTLLNNTSTAKTVEVSNLTLYSGYSTEAVVTSQRSTERNELTGYDPFYLNLTYSASTNMASSITYSPTIASTLSATSSHSLRPDVTPNVTLKPVDRDDAKSEKDSATAQSSEPIISSTETTGQSKDSSLGADDVDKTAVRRCPCVCQTRGNRTYQPDIPAADMLKVSVGNLSRHWRSRNSASDSRPLSVSLGVGGIAVFVCTVVFTLLPSVVKQRHSTEWKRSR